MKKKINFEEKFIIFSFDIIITNTNIYQLKINKEWK
jgi:hypothetical protein